jgi:hypothetical protein
MATNRRGAGGGGGTRGQNQMQAARARLLAGAAAHAETTPTPNLSLATAEQKQADNATSSPSPSVVASTPSEARRSVGSPTPTHASSTPGNMRSPSPTIGSSHSHNNSEIDRDGNDRGRPRPRHHGGASLLDDTDEEEEEEAEEDERASMQTPTPRTPAGVSRSSRLTTPASSPAVAHAGMTNTDILMNISQQLGALYTVLQQMNAASMRAQSRTRVSKFHHALIASVAGNMYLKNPFAVEDDFEDYIKRQVQNSELCEGFDDDDITAVNVFVHLNIKEICEYVFCMSCC